MNESLGLPNLTVAVSGFTDRSVCSTHILFAAELLDRSTHSHTHTHTERSGKQKGHYFGAECLCDWADKASEEYESIRPAWLAMDLTFIHTSVCVCVGVWQRVWKTQAEAEVEWTGRKSYVLYIHFCFSIIPVAFLINIVCVCVCVCVQRQRGTYSVCNFTFPLYFLYFHYSGPRQPHREPNAEQMFTSDTRWNMWKMVCAYGRGPQSLCSPAIIDQWHPGISRCWSVIGWGW